MESLKFEAIYMYIDISRSRHVFSTLHDGTKILTYIADSINTAYQDQLLTPFTIKDGDAIVGGVSDFQLLPDIYSHCLTLYYSPHFKAHFSAIPAVVDETLNFYFGVGIGYIDTPATEDLQNINIVNGTSIINAIEASERAKQIMKSQQGQRPSAIDSDEDYFFDKQPFKFYCIAEPKSFGNAVNAMFFLAFEKLIKSDKQRDLFRMKDSYPDYSNIKIGTALGYGALSKADISSRISVLIANSDYFLYKKIRLDIVAYLADLQKMMGGASHG
ncbi:hypothetical protein PGRAN_11606 [Listeria grandensis FSL F6-0971]|uniref:Uncharacterized protein n=1 Tax=Listeria grandensis FSL F6-0971 TaxID=1265819 RepID=W7BHV4_9LIST|nr:hypothetical protein [Listeria grandensis]EUJ22796.1 hypothetical protein PGRAN_11606 [Listeria grandensis FSL F6-0971]